MSFFSYNFFRDKNALDSYLPSLNSVDSFLIENGIFTHLNILSGEQDIDSGTIPEEWTGLTLFDCDFSSLNGGNLEFTAENTSKILVKRRIQGDIEWITLAEVIIETELDMNFVHHDYYNASGVTYEYALVNVDLQGNEQAYQIGTIDSVFNKVFIVESDKSYDLTNATVYDSSNRVQQTGIYETFGRKYPIVVANGNLNYTQMTTSALLMINTGSANIDRNAQKNLQNNFLNFLLDRKSKILKDYNGNIWVLAIVNSPSSTYIKELGNGLCSTNFEWVEIGDSNNSADLKSARLIPVKPIYSQTQE